MLKASLKIIVYLFVFCLFAEFSCPVVKAETVYEDSITVGGNPESNAPENVIGILMTAPMAAPAPGNHNGPQTVILSKPTGALEIRYTTDGSVPDCVSLAGAIYSAPIPVNSSLSIKAVSCYPENHASAVAVYDYTISSNNIVVSGGGGVSVVPPANVLTVQAQKVDVNKDNKIDVLDFNSLMVNWGAAVSAAGAGSVAVADFSGDGKVDILDFNMLMVNWTG